MKWNNTLKLSNNLIRYFLFTTLRFTVLCWNRPKAMLAFGLLRAQKIMPLATLTTVRENVSAVRKKIKRNHQSWGWAVEKRHFVFRFLDMTICTFTISDACQLNLLTFFLNRNPKPIRVAMEKFDAMGSPIRIDPGMKVFEPGCNAGRNLFFFRDYHGASIVGADIYEPAVRLARKADIFKSADIRVADLVNGDYLSQFRANEFDLTIIRSHLVHVAHIEPSLRDAYFKRLLRISRRVLVIEKQNKVVDQFLSQYGFRVIRGEGVAYGFWEPSNSTSCR